MKTEKVMFSISQLKIILAKRVLAEAGIEAFVLNQLDSMHAGAFGNVKLFVAKDKANEAKSILAFEGIIEG